MEHYVGIDVCLELSSVCVVDVGGKIVAKAKVESHPDVIINFLDTDRCVPTPLYQGHSIAFCHISREYAVN